MARGKKQRKYKVRKAIVYICMGCAMHFNASREAKDHWKSTHYVARPKRGPGRPRKNKK